MTSITLGLTVLWLTVLWLTVLWLTSVTILGLTVLITSVTILGLIGLIKLGCISGLGQLVVNPLSDGEGIGAGLCKQCAFKRFIEYGLESQCDRHFLSRMVAAVHGEGKGVLGGVSPIDLSGEGLINHVIDQGCQYTSDVAQQVGGDPSVFDVCVLDCIVQALHIGDG